MDNFITRKLRKRREKKDLEIKKQKTLEQKTLIVDFLRKMGTDPQNFHHSYSDEEVIEIAGNISSNIIFKHFPRFKSDMECKDDPKDSAQQEEFNSHVYNLANAFNNFIDFYMENPEIKEFDYGIARKDLPAFDPSAPEIKDQNRLTGPTKTEVYNAKLKNGHLDFRIESIENYSLADSVIMIENYLRDFTDFLESNQAQNVVRTNEQFRGIRDFVENKCSDVLTAYSGLYSDELRKTDQKTKQELMGHIEKVVGAYERAKKRLIGLGVKESALINEDVVSAVSELGDVIITRKFPYEREENTTGEEAVQDSEVPNSQSYRNRTPRTGTYVGKQNIEEYMKTPRPRAKHDTKKFWNDSKYLVDKKEKEK